MILRYQLSINILKPNQTFYINAYTHFSKGTNRKEIVSSPFNPNFGGQNSRHRQNFNIDIFINTRQTNGTSNAD